METNQACPNEAIWRVWRKATKLWTSIRKLDKLLGRWIVSGDQLHCNWPAYYDYNTGHLYVKQYDKYLQYQQDKEIVGDIKVQQDGIFQQYLKFLDK
eukprot:2808111-Ditylum_brightwellii.AAC.1